MSEFLKSFWTKENVSDISYVLSAAPSLMWWERDFVSDFPTSVDIIRYKHNVLNGVLDIAYMIISGPNGFSLFVWASLLKKEVLIWVNNIFTQRVVFSNDSIKVSKSCFNESFCERTESTKWLMFEGFVLLVWIVCQLFCF